MRRSAGWCRELGAGLVVSEMTASDALIEGRPQCRAARRRTGHRHPCRPARRLRAALDGGGRAHRRGRRRRDHRHQHGLPGQARRQPAIGLGADARPRSCADADRGHGRRGRRAGDAEDAARLGRPLDQRAGAGPARGGGRRPHGHRAWPHALPVLHRHGRLGRGARGQGRDLDSARGQRRHPQLRRRRRGAARLRRRRRHGRPRGAGAAVVPGQIARYLETGRREARRRSPPSLR